MKFVISNHHARGDFLKRVAKLCKCRARSRICAGSCPLGDNVNFVGNNNEAAVSNLFDKRFWFSKPCFYCSSHLFTKILIRSMIIIFTYFPVNNLLSTDECLKIFVSSTLAMSDTMTRKK